MPHTTSTHAFPCIIYPPETVVVAIQAARMPFLVLQPLQACLHALFASYHIDGATMCIAGAPAALWSGHDVQWRVGASW